MNSEHIPVDRTPAYVDLRREWDIHADPNADIVELWAGAGLTQLYAHEARALAAELLAAADVILQQPGEWRVKQERASEPWRAKKEEG